METIQARKNRRIREKSRRHIDKLYARQLSLCFWCKSQTVIVRHIPNSRLINLTGTHVKWFEGGEVYFAKVATIDHVKPLRDGGDGTIENCVMACAECNSNRTKTPSMVPEPIRKMCPECRGEKPKHRRSCLPCFVKKSKAFLADHGWTEVVSHQSDQSKFRNPNTGELHILRAAFNECWKYKRIVEAAGRMESGRKVGED